MNKQATKGDYRGRLIWGSTLIIGGILLLYFFSYLKYDKTQFSKDWPTTFGTITKAKIVAHVNGSDHSNQEDLQMHSLREGNLYRVDINYSYLVNGNEYDCNKKCILQTKDEGYRKLAKAIRVKENYLYDPTVTVYYNPENPNDAILRTGLSALQWLVVCLPSILLILGIFLIVSVFKINKTN